MAKVGFVGLGIMGNPMAGHLIDAGHTLYLYDI
ncbi:MAG: 2-hydroxy-3-oxopropionate reductase, partial [Xanthobacteraceae bacterium]|nr:2-hydroxy-3-oxopropionate reductase [Xanthobacteraceae bacterium]MDF2619768.1 2-hydroxy-3-oxopropionate reductase [Xanthobacteraceae bacterium]